MSAVELAVFGTTGGFTVDTQDREAVRFFFNSVYAHRANVRADWTGSIENCLAGTTSPAYRDAVLTRINFYRAMAGVPSTVTFSGAYSLRAQEAALIMSANDELSHSPVEGWLCFGTLGAEGADNSNLALGNAGMDAVDSYIMDAGPNYRAGHRRWLIYPQSKVMGTGDIDPADGSDDQKANAIWIFDDHFLDPRPATRDGFVAWPPPGYVPHRLVFPRWSFQVPRADFTNSVVTMTSNGVPVEVRREKVEIGYGENGVVFVPHGIAPQTRMFWPKPSDDVVYEVRIDNVVPRGGAPTNYTYQVIVFDPEQPAGEWSGIRPLGSSAPQAQRANTYRYREFPNASGYDFRAASLENHNEVEGAENGQGGVISWLSGLYPLVQTNIAASGQSAFHLAHSKPPRPQWFQLARTFVPGAGSELRFQSRLGGALNEQIARVQVSLDDGSSWRDIYEQAGKGTLADSQNPGETDFVLRTVPLGAFAGRALWIRFNYGFAFGPVSFARGANDGVGWYIDDIEVTHAQHLATVALENRLAPEHEFVPNAPGEYYLDARARYQDEYTGEWSLGAFVTAVEPEPTVLTLRSIRTVDGDRVRIDYTASSVANGAEVKVQSAPSSQGPWQTEIDVIGVFPMVEGFLGLMVLKRSGAGTGFYRLVAE